LLKNFMVQPLRPGDFFRISTRSMAASGYVVKVARVNVFWRAEYQPAPGGPVHHLSGKIPLYQFKRATVFRDGAVFSIL
jgi:hypothetical protein